MMYKNSFVVVIKNKGKVLREDSKGVVRLPFGSEYTILLKNKDSRKAVVDVEIDDRDVAGGLIIPANESFELKGFLDGLRVRNKFKFIQKTKEIQDYRGDRLGDGLVRVEYKFEKKYEEPVWKISQPVVPIIYQPVVWPKSTRHTGPYTFTTSGWVYSDISCETYSCSNSSDVSEAPSIFHLNASVPVSDEGITVKGSETKQNFVCGTTNQLESQSSVIILHLKGSTVKHGKVKQAVTVRTKLRCSTCGKKSKSNAKFCINCGTYL